MSGLEFLCKAIFIGISVFLVYAFTPSIKLKFYRYSVDRTVGIGVILTFLAMGLCFFKWLVWNG